MADLSSGKLPAQTHTLSVKERVALGRALRERLARKHHARWAPQRQRRDPIEILIEQGQSRLPDLLPLRHARMKASPFAFMRGAAAVMASDLATTEVSGLRVQAAGDCHCLNFGGFATPERRLAFDINDFDETAVAPFEWDVKRLAASVVVATLDQFGADARLDLAQSVARAYREIMARIAGRTVLDEWYRVLTLDEAEARAIGLDGKALKKADRALKHAVTLIDMRHTGGRSPTIQDQPPLVYHPPRSRGAAFRGDVETMLAEYVATLSPERQLLLQRYRLADAAYKVVGVGAVGTLCGVVLMVSGDGEALYLQFKEATQSVLEPFAGTSPYAHHGERVVQGQRLIQAASDILLGYANGPTGRHIYIRQLRDAKLKPVLETMTAKDFRRYAETCGEVLARAHARTADAVVLASYLGKSEAFDEAIARFAAAYARQTEQDHDALVKAIKSKRLPASAEIS
ncbi:MAG TPA: DUF2252 domain-containing protein [Reyranella sp.]|nr:DUF2252 domain-containing protein [Reyranella sp.]